MEGKEDLPREALKTNQSTIDRIYKHLYSKTTKVELDAEEKSILMRWEKAWLLLCRHRTRNAVAQLIQKLFNVSRSTAYDDVNNAMHIFSDPRQDMKAAKRAIAEENYLKGADKAWKKGNLEMHKKYMDSYADINGLRDDNAGSNLEEFFKKYKPVQVVMTFKKEDLMNEVQQIQNEIEKTIDVDFEAA